MNIYQEWLDATEVLAKAKKDELRLRNLICSRHLVDKLEGSKTEIVDGFKVTPTAKLTRSIDREMLEAIWDDLPDTEKMCIEYKPSLKLANYKQIEQSGGLLLQAITVKPAQASLKIVPIVEEE